MKLNVDKVDLERKEMSEREIVCCIKSHNECPEYEDCYNEDGEDCKYLEIVEEEKEPKTWIMKKVKEIKREISHIMWMIWFTRKLKKIEKDKI